MQLYFLYLSRRLWQVVLGLAAMPLCALVAAVLLTFQKYESAAVNTLTMNHGLVVLPFVLLTSTVLLSAVLILADHERLERASQLAGLREICYQGLQRSKRFCDNEAANVVLSAKAEVMEQEGITADFAVSLPKELSVADADLAALLGNALDNAIEGVQNAPTKKVILCCSVDKGLLMLRLENPVGGKVNPDLSTTKKGKTVHGFGLPGMREIARQYHGTLEAGMEGGQFILIICLMV